MSAPASVVIIVMSTFTFVFYHNRLKTNFGKMYHKYMNIRVCLASGQELKRLIFTEKWDDEVSMASLTRCVQRCVAVEVHLYNVQCTCHFDEKKE